MIGTLISDLVLQLLSYVAQTEREFNHTRQAEGIAAAKARGVHCGRPPMDKPDKYFEALCKWNKGDLSANAAARIAGVSRPTFLRWAREK